MRKAEKTAYFQDTRKKNWSQKVSNSVLFYNRNLDSREQLLDFMAFEEISKEEEGDEDDDEIADLDMVGLDCDELSMMDEDERREALEDAGLNPDDYDF